MHIGVDASRATVAQRTGTESYARNLIQALLAGFHSAHTFTLYFRNAPPADTFPGVVPRVIPFPRLWTHLRLSWELLVSPRPDVLFVPAHVVPLIHPVPAVVTVHDLGYHYFPTAHPVRQRLYLEWSTRFSVQVAARVIADSQATARDLQRWYGVAADKITVVYPGRDETLRPTDPAAVRAKYQLPDQYLLHVGTLQPRKNLSRLIEASAHLAFPLVLVGRQGWLSAPLIQQARAAQVRILDYVPDADLAGLYSGAAVFVFPSLYEGFGFPVLEAMACGTPVVCSNTSSLPEVAGDAALQVDPEDSAALAAAITRLLTERDLRQALVERGRRQVAQFSWARAARETLGVLEAAVAERTPPGRPA